MDNPPQRWKMIALIVAIVVIIAIGATIVILQFNADGTPVTGASGGATVTTVTNGNARGESAATPIPSATQTPVVNGANPQQSVPILPSPVITITLLTPISGNVWKIGGANPIAWDNPATITGEIELVDAVTKAFIGVILSETGSKQTSYTWDARSIYLARYSADKKDVVPGTYSIRIHFDGNDLGDLVSGPITITN